MELESSLLDELNLQREKNKLLVNIIDAIPDPIVAKNYKGNFVYVNKAVANLYNTTPDKMIGHDDGYFTGNQQQADFFKENIQKIIDSGLPERVYEESTDAKTGEIRYYYSHKTPFVDSKGNRNIMVIAKDITDITKLKIQAEENEKRLNYVLESTQEGIWDWNIESGYVFHNDYWCELVGIEKATSNFEEFVSFIHPNDRAMVKGALKQALEDHKPYQVRFRIVRANEKGTIWVQDRGMVVETNDKNQPTRMVGSIFEITNEVKKSQKINMLAFYDSLTGLPNRRSLDDELLTTIKKHVAKKVYGALLFLDLDHFKVLNDTHGHYMGDALLVQVSKRIQDRLDDNDIVARFGGDEFVIILNNLSDNQEAASAKAIKIAQEIKKCISQPILLTNKQIAIPLEYEVASSVGIVMFPEESDNPERLLQLADLALYKAKEKGRDNIILFEAPA